MREWVIGTTIGDLKGLPQGSIPPFSTKNQSVEEHLPVEQSPTLLEQPPQPFELLCLKLLPKLLYFGDGQVLGNAAFHEKVSSVASRSFHDGAWTPPSILQNAIDGRHAKVDASGLR